MHLQPYLPRSNALLQAGRQARALIGAGRHTRALTVGAATAGALVAGTVAVSRALARRSDQAVQAPDEARPRATSRRPVVAHRLTVSMTVIEEWISPAGDG